MRCYGVQRPVAALPVVGYAVHRIEHRRAKLSLLVGVVCILAALGHLHLDCVGKQLCVGRCLSEVGYVRRSVAPLVVAHPFRQDDIFKGYYLRFSLTRVRARVFRLFFYFSFNIFIYSIVKFLYIRL